jgi:hypothetical protein
MAGVLVGEAGGLLVAAVRPVARQQLNRHGIKRRIEPSLALFMGKRGSLTGQALEEQPNMFVGGRQRGCPPIRALPPAAIRGAFV